MLKKWLVLFLAVTFALSMAACKPKTPSAGGAEAPSMEQAKSFTDQAKQLVADDAEPEKMLTLIEEALLSSVEAVGTDEAEIMFSGLEQLQESHLTQYTDEMVTEANQETLALITEDINNPSVIAKIGDSELVSLLEKLVHSGYKFESFQDVWQPIVDYGSYRKYMPLMSQELQDYMTILAMESDRVSIKDGTIVVSLDELGARLAAAETYIVKYGDSPRSDRIKDAYAGYLWTFIGGSNNTLIYDRETLVIRQDVRDSYERFSRTNPNLISNRAVRNWITVLRDAQYVFDENTMYQSLDSIYGETLADLGIDIYYK